MLRLHSAQSKLIGFSYFPLLEIAVGTFLLIVAITVPLLFAKYNGFKSSQTGEWIACIIFMLFFLMLGKSLTFQKMKVGITRGTNVRFYQNMRDPQVTFDIKQSEWKGVNITEENGFNNEKLHVINIVSSTETFEFYKSINKKEISQITSALEQLRKSI